MIAPAVSVLMPAYNSAAHIDEAVRSVIGQTFDDWELVVVDDGSRDATREIVSSFHDPRIIVHALPTNQGLVAALNYGLSRCRAPLVARFDADDRCHPCRLEKQVERMGADAGLGVLGTSAREIDAAGTAIGERRSPTGRSLIDRLVWSNALIHPSVMFRKDVIEAVGGYRAVAGRYEDFDLWLRVASIADMDNIDETLLDYRVHAGQVTARRTFGWRAANAVGRSRIALARCRHESSLAASARQACWLLWQVRREIPIARPRRFHNGPLESVGAK